MLWVGLTGGIATGKSTVSKLLMVRGLPVVDADVLAREAVQIGTVVHAEIVQAFGPDAVLSDGQLNRKRIGEIVFRDPVRLQWLESVIHPEVRRLAEAKRRELQSQGHQVAFYDVPLLFEKKMESLFDRVVVVACSPELQLQRLIARDGLTEEEAKRRIATQLPITDKVKKADEVIVNDGSLQDLERAVDEFVGRVLGPRA